MQVLVKEYLKIMSLLSFQDLNTLFCRISIILKFELFKQNIELYKKLQNVCKQNCITSNNHTNITLDESVFKQKNRLVCALKPFVTSIQTIDLTYCTDITDDVAIALLEHCPHLKSIRFDSCTKLTDKTFEVLAKNRHHLENLYLWHCSNITDTAVMKLAVKCVHLHKIEFYGCTNLTDTAFEALADHCHHLRELHLCKCAKITDKLVEKLAEKCIHLQSLSLYGCVNITDKVVDTLMNCSELREICLKYTQITTSAKRELQSEIAKTK